MFWTTADNRGGVVRSAERPETGRAVSRPDRRDSTRAFFRHVGFWARGRLLSAAVRHAENRIALYEITSTSRGGRVSDAHTRVRTREICFTAGLRTVVFYRFIGARAWL